MGLYGFGGMEPQVASDAFVAPTAMLIGDVVLEAESSVWFGAVLRADFGRIDVGAGVACRTTPSSTAPRTCRPSSARTSLVGHGAMLEGCVIEDGALIGMGAIVLQRARVGAGRDGRGRRVVGEGRRSRPGCSPPACPRARRRLSGSALPLDRDRGRGVPASSVAATWRS